MILYYLLIYLVALLSGVAIGMVAEWYALATERDKAALEERFRIWFGG